MTRDEGFTVMDVSTSVCDDPKFRRLAREAPQHVAVAFTAYLATMAESWRIGRRVNVRDAWPAILPYDDDAIECLIRVELLDKRGVLASKGWRSWFEPARERRQKARDRWARYNAQRTGDTTPPPRGNDADTATSVRSFRPSVPSEPSAPSARARGKKNGLETVTTREDAIRFLDAEFAAGRLDAETYHRQREAIA